jgi:IS30 family transposase
MSKGYHQLTYEARCQIYALLKSGQSLASIAHQLGVHRSTIGRELKRNSGGRGYRYKQAQAKASDRRAQASREPRKMTPDIVRLIAEKLTQEQWSPEQISGWLLKEDIVSVSPECIYQHIRTDRKQGGNLHSQLRHGGKPYNRRQGKTSGRGLIPNRVDIDERPAIVERKSRIGDWEADTLIGARHQGAILSYVDRKSKYTKLSKLVNTTAQGVLQASSHILSPHTKQVHTITFDNGKEFSGHADIATKLNAKTYFAKPYHAWERGLNEHTNGLVRQYFPKGTDFTTITQADIQRVEDKLNSRPRKVLQFRTPSEVFFSAT